jgi:hypothetical protein
MGVALGTALAVCGSLVGGRFPMFFAIVGGASCFVLCTVSPSANPWRGVVEMSIFRTMNAAVCSVASLALMLMTRSDPFVAALVDFVASAFFFFAGMKLSDIWVRRVFK